MGGGVDKGYDQFWGDQNKEKGNRYGQNNDDN